VEVGGLVGVVLALAACDGEMTGQVRGTGERVVFSYEQGMNSDTYRTVIGGEKFVGKAGMDGSTSAYGVAAASRMIT